MQHRRRQHVFQAAKKQFQQTLPNQAKNNQEEPSGIRFSGR